MLKWLIGSILLVYVFARPSKPVLNIDRSDARGTCFVRSKTGGSAVNFVADERNNCWYWRCLNFFGRIVLSPQSCPLGTAVSDFYSVGSTPPCSRSFDPRAAKFDCTRKQFRPDERPPCYFDYTERGVCQNGGEVLFENDLCWCKCPLEYRGDWNCGRRTRTVSGQGATSLPSNTTLCSPSNPRENFCLSQPCQNGGSCRNQCDGYYCLCIQPFTAGKNCEKFDCTDNVECLNGGTCSRGDGNMDQIFTCRCVSGFTGAMCEIAIR